MSTSPETPGDRALPPPSADFGCFVATAEADWSIRIPSSSTWSITGASWLVASGRSMRPIRELIRGEAERARHFAAMQNHDLMTTARDRSSPCSSSPRRRCHPRHR